MAEYTFRSIEDRRKIQELWNTGAAPKEIADAVGMALSTLYTELRRGFDGTRLPDMRRRYDAELAQRTVQEGFERRGRKAAEA